MPWEQPSPSEWSVADTTEDIEPIDQRHTNNELRGSGSEFSNQICFCEIEEDQGATHSSDTIIIPEANTIYSQEWRHLEPSLRVQSEELVLEFMNYHKEEIKMYLPIVMPLTNLSHKDNTDKFGPEEEHAFITLKLCLIQAPILARSNFEKTFIHQIDWSKFAIGAILAQKLDGKREKCDCLL